MSTSTTTIETTTTRKTTTRMNNTTSNNEMARTSSKRCLHETTSSNNVNNGISQTQNHGSSPTKVQRVVHPGASSCTISNNNNLKNNNHNNTKNTAISQKKKLNAKNLSLQDFVLAIAAATCGVSNLRIHSFESSTNFFHAPTEAEIACYNQEIISAVRNKDLQTLRLFHKQGRPLKCSNKFGESILHLACRKGLLEVVDFLLNEANVPIQVRDDYGRTPLHDAFWTAQPNYDVVDLIIRKCPDLLYIRDRRGYTPMIYARRETWDQWKTHFTKMIQDVIPRHICYVGKVAGVTK